MHDGDGRGSKSIWSQQPVITPERKLWRAVLEQAYLDAEIPPSLDGSHAIKAVRAQRYLRGDSDFEAEDLELVCDFAEIPADRIVLWARRRFPLAA